MTDNYSFYNLCSWTNDHEITAPMSPAYAIKPIREIMKGKFGGLTRVNFSGKFDGAYQEIEDIGKRYPTTGYDTLLYKAIYSNAISILFFVDRGIGLEPIAEMTKFTGEDSKVTVIDPERDKKYFQILSQDELFVMFERANAYIKINQKDESKQPVVAISL
jgi:hypothetical protein